MRRMVRLLTKMLLQCPSRHHCRPHLSFAARVIVAVSSPSLPTNGTNVPLISSSNPDNFYVLYSQLNYNVVV